MPLDPSQMADMANAAAQGDESAQQAIAEHMNSTVSQPQPNLLARAGQAVTDYLGYKTPSDPDAVVSDPLPEMALTAAVGPLANGAARGLVNAAEAPVGALMADEAGVMKLPSFASKSEQAIAGANQAMKPAAEDSLYNLAGNKTQAAIGRNINAVSRQATHEARFAEALKNRKAAAAKGKIRFAEGGEVASPQPSEPSQLPVSTQINVVNPEGDLVSIPAERAQSAYSMGYSPASPERVAQYAKEQEFGTPSQQLLTGLEGAASAATFGASTGAERALGVSPESIAARREVNPTANVLGQTAGLVGSTALGYGAGPALERAGALAVEKAGLAGATNTLAKVGSAAVKNAVETALVQGGDEVSKMFSRQSDPNTPVQTALADIGLSGLIGGAVGAPFGAISPLWKATQESKMGQLLKIITDKATGAEGSVPDTITEALDKAGVNVSPEVRAGLSSNPHVQEMFKTLEQSDTTAAGKELQQKAIEFRHDLSKGLVSAIGKDPAALESLPELDKYTYGKNLGDTLAKEYETKIAPLSQEFEALKEKYSTAPLQPDHKIKVDVPPATPYENATTTFEVVPGDISRAQEKLATLAAREGWTSSPSSDIMKALRQAQRELKGVQDLRGLTQYITRVGENTASTLPFGMQTPLSRAGMLIKRELQNIEEEVALNALGKEAPELATRYQVARQEYRKLSNLKDELDQAIGAKGSTSGYAKGIREMARTDGEGLLRKLTGDGDASTLELLKNNFPETAAKIKEFHLDRLVRAGVDKAKNGEPFNASAFLKAVSSDKMSPQLRDFVLPPGAMDKINAISTVLDKYNSLPHNFSNTARTIDKLSGGLVTSAMGMAAYLTGHNPATALLLGGVGKIIGKDAPDSIKLALLKFLGSDKQIDAQGFKTMVDFIHAAAKGESKLTNGAKQVFKSGTQVLSEHAVPTQAQRDRLDKHLKKLQTDPSPLFNAGGKTAHYLPEAGAGIGMTAGNAVNYLNQQRPVPRRLGPLDTPIEPTKAEKAAFNRLLDIAQTPLSLYQKVKDGSITSTDIMALKSMYPKLYERMSDKISMELTNAVDKGTPIPYNTKLGLSLFLGQPVDSTLTPNGIMSAQPKPQGMQSQTPTQPAQNPKRSTSSLNKMSGMFQTPGQKAEQNMRRP